MMTVKQFQTHQKRYWERNGLAKRRHPAHPVIEAYVLPKINILRSYVDLKPETRLLDVGCGNGFFTFYFDKICNAYGIDYSEIMLQMNPVKKTSIMNASDLRFEDNSFDAVFCHALLHHVDDIDRVIQEMRRVSRRYVIILEPNRNNPLMFLFSLLVKEERQAIRFSLPYLIRALNRNALSVIASFSYGMIAPNKTPAFFIPLAGLFNFKHPLGITNFIIAEKLQ